MSRNLRQQFNYCIAKCDKRGSKKRSDRLNKVDTSTRIYSNKRIECLRNTVDEFCTFMKETHPEIRMVDKVTSEHVQEFIDAHIVRWSTRSEGEMISRFHKLNEVTNHVYGRHNNWKLHTNERINQGNIRTMAMDKKDYENIKGTLKNGRSEAKHAIEITYRCGARIAEACGLKVEGIRTDKWVIEIREGAKAGKIRDVPIRPQDRQYFADLKKEMEAKGRIYVTNGIKSDSANKAIRRTMKELGISEKYPDSTDHTVRKLYARERMEEERPSSRSEVEAWERVQVELGHGDKSRKALYETYVGGILV